MSHEALTSKQTSDQVAMLNIHRADCTLVMVSADMQHAMLAL